jgi:hypothetical protein
MDNTYIYLANGQYLGFVADGCLFSRDGIYLGWVEGTSVWDKNGSYRGVIFDINGHTYILRHKFIVTPIQRAIKAPPAAPAIPPPVANIPRIVPPLPYGDAFENTPVS